MARVGGAACPHPVAEHATPLFRELAGVERRLQENKVVNLAIALEGLDGLVLPPGARFSFWRHVRRPTARRGFLPAVVLSHGRVTEGVGGGLCQLTNLLFWLTLHTPLEVRERWRHSYDVFPDQGRTQPFGSGATCAWPSLDLQVANPTDVPYRLSVRVGPVRLEGAWTGVRPLGVRYEVYEAAHVIEPLPAGGYVRRNVLRRRTSDDEGRELADEVVAVNHALLRYRPFLPGGTAHG